MITQCVDIVGNSMIFSATLDSLPRLILCYKEIDIRCPVMEILRATALPAIKINLIMFKFYHYCFSINIAGHSRKRSE